MYQLATSAARDPEVNLTAHVRKLGVKPSQSDGLLMGHQRLYYGCLAGDQCQNALAYWSYRRIMNQTGDGLDDLTMDNHTEFYRNATTMGWPDTFSMDDQGYLWVVSNRLHEFTAGEMDFSGASGSNFRVSRYHWPDDRSYLYKDHRTSDGLVNYCSLFTVLFAFTFTVIYCSKSNQILKI